MINPTLPLVDLHRHLDGNIAPKTVWELAQLHNITLPAKSLEQFAPMAQIQGQTSDLMAFLTKLDYGVSVLADYDSVYRIARENVFDALAQGLDYTELRFSPYYMAKTHNLDPQKVVEVVIDATQTASKETGVATKLIGILSRTFGVEACTIELNALLAHKEHIVALDLAGDEISLPAELFVEHFKLARDAGLQITVHAGEADGPKSIWNAINLLGATRIGHGVAATQDPKLMAYLATNNIAIESCPTSNYQTATINDIRKHPLKQFIDAGITVCLNTDDPAISNITLAHEYELVKNILGLTNQEIEQVQKNGVEAAFMDAQQRQRLYAKVAARG